MSVLEPLLLFANLYYGQDLLIDDNLLQRFSEESNVHSIELPSYVLFLQYRTLDLHLPL